MFAIAVSSDAIASAVKIAAAAHLRRSVKTPSMATSSFAEIVSVDIRKALQHAGSWTLTLGSHLGRLSSDVAVGTAHDDGPLPAREINRRSDRNSFLAGDSGHRLFRKPDASISLEYRRRPDRRNEDAQSAKREISNFRGNRRNTVAPPSRVRTFVLARFGLLMAIY